MIEIDKLSVKDVNTLFLDNIHKVERQEWCVTIPAAAPYCTNEKRGTIGDKTEMMDVGFFKERASEPYEYVLGIFWDDDLMYEFPFLENESGELYPVNSGFEESYRTAMNELKEQSPDIVKAIEEVNEHLRNHGNEKPFVLLDEAWLIPKLRGSTKGKDER